jgi:hypothetical protein
MLSQVFCIFLFLCAASLFGTIIAQVNEIVAHLTTKKKDLDTILEAYLVLNPRFPKSSCHLSRQAFFRLRLKIIRSWSADLNHIASLQPLIHICYIYGAYRLDLATIFEVRKWERFQFMIDYEAQQVI